MRSLRRLFAALLVGATIAAAPPAPIARACSFDETTEFATSTHPDLPLDDYVAGQLGLLKTTFARSHLVIAYRTLGGMPLDPVEQAGALQVIHDRIYDDVTVSRRPAPASAPDATSAWSAARTAALGSAGAAPATTLTRNYAAVGNCYDDTFTKATETLADRARRYGAGSAELRAWIAAEDLVLANCGGGPAQVPPALKPPKDKLAASDRDYQIASAYFYALDYAQADKRLRAIAADADSPWQPWGRYLAARNATRQALAGEKPDLKLLARAEADLQAVLADPSLSAIHHAARGYLGYVRAHGDVARATREAGVRLATKRLGADFQQALADYTWLLDADASPLAPGAPDDDRLSAWIGVLKGTTPAAFDRAERLYQRTGSPLWLVAALMKADPARGARLDPLLKAAEALPKGSPAYATASYHRLRLLAARGGGRGVFDQIVEARAALRPADGRSTLNEYTALAMRAAPTLDDALENAFVVPAGTRVDGSAITPTTKAPARLADPEGALSPEAAELLAALPLAALKRAARSPKLPEALRAHLAATAWARALLLGDAATAKDLAVDVRRSSPDLAPIVDEARKAGDEAKRRLALLHALLTAPSLSKDPKPWTRGTPKLEPIDSSHNEFWWCPRTGAAASVPAFLTAAERTAAEREQKALPDGAGSTFLANEAARLAEKLPSDEGLAELLHLAVRATRYGCRDAETSKASSRAFHVLHRKYPKSPWTRETRFSY